jgi:hypothetical protein
MFPDTGGWSLAGLIWHGIQVPGHVELAEYVLEILASPRASWPASRRAAHLGASLASNRRIS